MINIVNPVNLKIFLPNINAIVDTKTQHIANV